MKYDYGKDYETNGEKPTSDTNVGSNWYERGDLPPANTECEVKIEGQWLPTVVIGHYDNEAVVAYPCITTQKFFSTTLNNLRPVRSERDVLIGKASNDTKSAQDKYNVNISCSVAMRGVVDDLIDAGWRPVKQQSEVVARAIETAVELYTHKWSNDEELNKVGIDILRRGVGYIYPAGLLEYAKQLREGEGIE